MAPRGTSPSRSTSTTWTQLNDDKMDNFQPLPSPQQKKCSSTEETQRSTLLTHPPRVLVITIVIIGFLTFWDKVTRLWGAAGDFWQAQWDKVLDITSDDPFNLYVYGTTIVTAAVYWIGGGLYTFLDVTNKPASMRRYKLQPGTNEPVETKRVLEVIMCVLINQTIVNLPIAHLHYSVMQWRGFPPVRILPSLHVVLLQILVCMLLQEMGFYYSHRLLHTRLFYQSIHKRHHEWRAPIAITAGYCHPVEHILSNVIPLSLGVYLTGCHLLTSYLWYSFGILFTLNLHCGYHLPFFPSPEAHEFHHIQLNQCFGGLGLLDPLHGTDKIYKSTPAYARHRVNLNLTPAQGNFLDKANIKSN